MSEAAATLNLVYRLYAAPSRPDAFAAALEVVVAGLEARAGCVLVAPAGEEPAVVAGSAALRDALEAGDARAVVGPLLESAGVHYSAELAAAANAPGAALVLVAHHPPLAASAWVLLRDARLSPADGIRAGIIAENLGHVGLLALARGRDGGAALPSPLGQRLGGRSGPGASTRARGRGTAGLPERTAACARLAARGYTNAEIAHRLRVSIATVARELHRAYRALNVRGRRELDIATLLSEPKPE